MGVRSGLARWLTCAWIAAVASCDALSLGERVQSGIGDGGIAVDDAIVIGEDAFVPPDMPTEGGPIDAPMEAGPADAGIFDAPMEAGPDAMIDAGPPPIPDAMPTQPDGGVPPGDGGPTDGGPGDGSLTDALGPDAPERPGFPVGGSNDDEIKSFYACSTGDGASALPLLVAILALRRRSFRGSGVT